MERPKVLGVERRTSESRRHVFTTASSSHVEGPPVDCTFAFLPDSVCAAAMRGRSGTSSAAYSSELRNSRRPSVRRARISAVSEPSVGDAAV